MLRRIPGTLVLATVLLLGGLGCKAKPPAAPALDSHKLVITNALWGALYEGLTTDVTALVRGQVRNDALSVTATTELLGEPARGKIKHLRVMYQKGGAVGRKTVVEGGTLTVGYDEKTTPLRLIVTKAVYGDFAGERTIDVTLRMADMVKDDALSVDNYNALFGDPAPKTSKQLRVDYTVDGQAKSKIVSENERLVLSVPRPSRLP